MRISAPRAEGGGAVTDFERKVLISDVLSLIAKALNEGAAGPCDYWYRQLADRLNKQALDLVRREP